MSQSLPSQTTQQQAGPSFHGFTFSQADYERTRSQIQRMLNSHGAHTSPSASPNNARSPNLPLKSESPHNTDSSVESQDTRNTAIELLGLGHRPDEATPKKEIASSPAGSKGSLDRFLSGDKVRHSQTAWPHVYL